MLSEPKYRRCVLSLMGPRKEDNSVLLLGTIMIICGLIAVVPAMFETRSAVADKASWIASRQAPIEAGLLVPARVIVPFTPNTTPSAR